MFTSYGPIASIRLIEDDHGRSKGSAFVVFENEDDAKRAMQGLNGTLVQGRAIIVTIADPNKKMRQREQENQERQDKHRSGTGGVYPISHSRHKAKLDLSQPAQPANTETGKAKSQSDFRKMMGL